MGYAGQPPYDKPTALPPPPPPKKYETEKKEEKPKQERTFGWLDAIFTVGLLETLDK